MSDLLARLISAGTDPSLVAEVAREIGRLEGIAEAAHQPDRAAENRRAYDRERKRAAKAANSTGIPPYSVENAESAETPPALDKETLSPRPPIKENNPTPRVGSALARKAAGFGPPENVEISLWNEFCSQRKKPLTRTAFDQILTKLAESAESGWPPGEIVARAIASSWETIFVPREAFSGSNRKNHGSVPQRTDGFTTALRLAAGGQAGYSSP